MPPKVPMRTASKPVSQPTAEETPGVFEVTDEQIEELQTPEAFTPEEQEIVAEMSPEIEVGDEFAPDPEQTEEEIKNMFDSLRTEPRPADIADECNEYVEPTQIDLIAGKLAEVRGTIDGLSVVLEELENQLLSLIGE